MAGVGIVVAVNFGAGSCMNVFGTSDSKYYIRHSPWVECVAFRTAPPIGGLSCYYYYCFSVSWHCDDGAYLCSFAVLPSPPPKESSYSHIGQVAAACAKRHRPQPVWPAEVHSGWAQSLDSCVSICKRTKVALSAMVTLHFGNECQKYWKE